jgi:hypothetical protein
MKLLFAGPAASGKTTLVAKFGEFLEKNGYKISRMNLDCAVETLPYKANFDIRNYFTLSHIMKKYGLGPNGALIKSVELLWRKRKVIKSFLEHEKSDFTLIDTPGQLELLIFHEKPVSKLFKKRSVCVFLMPADLIRTAKDYYFLRFLNVAVNYRLDMPCVYVISKCDLIKNFKFGRCRDEFSKKVSEILEYLESAQRLVFVSSKTKKGFSELLDLVYETFCICGDLT